jgi:hypothetical protein
MWRLVTIDVEKNAIVDTFAIALSFQHVVDYWERDGGAGEGEEEAGVVKSKLELQV